MNDRQHESWTPLWAGILFGIGLPLSVQGVITTFMAWGGLAAPERGASASGMPVVLGVIVFVAGVLLMSAGAAKLRGVLRSNVGHRAATGGDGRVIPYVWVRFASGIVVLGLAYAVYLALVG
ncbi:MAG: hypothetical protein ACYCYF_10820 [Anaerolineae bacterium]